jgi:hypothetical protein
MPEEYGTLNAVLGVFVGWGVIFFGIWVMPLSIDQKIFVDLANTIIFIGLGLIYFDFKGKIPLGKEMRIRIWFWFMVFMELFQGASAFLVTIATWEVVVINGYQVVTYENLASLLFSIIGTSVILYVVYLIKNREKYMEKRRKVPTKGLDKQ